MVKKNLYVLLADFCKTLSNPNRQAILDSLHNEELTVTEIKDRTGMTQANLSQHLSILRSKGVVVSRREGNNIFYSMSNPKINEACNLVCEVLKESVQSMDKAINAGTGANIIG